MAYKNIADRQTKERSRAAEKKNRLDAIKVERGCADCGYDAHPAALEWDHLPGYEKSRNVSTLVYASWDAIMAEVEKCEVVCCNCHAIRTMNRRGLYMDFGNTVNGSSGGVDILVGQTSR